MPVWTDMGNIQKFAVTPNATIIKHKKTRGSGLKTIDLTAMTLMEMTFEASLDEWTQDNILLALQGQIGTDTAGTFIKIGIQPVRRQLKFEGDNKYGARVQVILPNVQLNSKDAIEFMSDGDNDFAKLPLSGDVLFADAIGCFGTVHFLDGATGDAPVNTPDELNYYIGTGILYSAPLE